MSKRNHILYSEAEEGDGQIDSGKKNEEGSVCELEKLPIEGEGSPDIDHNLGDIMDDTCKVLKEHLILELKSSSGK